MIIEVSPPQLDVVLMGLDEVARATSFRHLPRTQRDAARLLYQRLIVQKREEGGPLPVGL